MSEATATTHADHSDGNGHDDHAHGHGNPHLAHHFDTMEQQYDSGKLGMWVFLATELLMFGGLFCAYSVYRANHPDVFLHAHSYLNTMMGAVNTAILLASSLTMAWGVRAAQLNQRKALIALLLATLCGGAGFMVIKAIEYNAKFEHHLAPGADHNMYGVSFAGEEGMNNPHGMKKLAEDFKAIAPPAAHPLGVASTPAEPFVYLDPNAGGGDAAKITPLYTADGSLAAEHQVITSGTAAHDAHAGSSPDQATPAHGAGLPFTDMESNVARQRVNTFFGIYYCMTGLHGVHVLVGMALILWIAYRAADSFHKAWMLPLAPLFIGAYLIFIWSISHADPFLYSGITVLALGGLWLIVRLGKAFTRKTTTIGEFNEVYFAPVDLVGLYWHLVDLIWIFLFPLLYLIHGKIGS